jgi:hypothetical protein
MSPYSPLFKGVGLGAHSLCLEKVAGTGATRPIAQAAVPPPTAHLRLEVL